MVLAKKIQRLQASISRMRWHDTQNVVLNSYSSTHLEHRCFNQNQEKVDKTETNNCELPSAMYVVGWLNNQSK
jgi:hypothetical protein